MGLLLAMGLATSACAAAKPGPALHCRHPLATIGSADGLPGSIATQLKPWMALHGERWNKTDSIGTGDLTASYLWAGQWKGDWIVAFSHGGESCCSPRLALFKPAAPGLAAYQQVVPPLSAGDLLGDVTCKGIDAVLDAYGGRA